MKQIRKKLLALVLCVTLCLPILGTQATAQNETGMTLLYSRIPEAGMLLSVEGLDGSRVIHGVELEITLKGSYPADQVMLEPVEDTAFSPAFATPVSQGNGETTVTLYLVSAYALNAESEMDLGYLTAGGKPAVPVRARLGLLDTEAMESGGEIQMQAVPVQEKILELPFTDVSEKAWYREAVEYVYQNSLMNGMGNGLFGPEGSTSRGMIVTILYRMEGEPVTNASSAFKDVPEGKWYTEAVIWANQNEIVQGYGDVFRPDNGISRQELATILYRYAGYKGLDRSARGSLAGFKDRGKVQTWARDAMGWAVGKELVKGQSATALDPNGGAARAQAATILMRFLQQA